MKKIILDLLKYSGISLFVTFLLLILMIVPMGLFGFLNGTNFNAPFRLFVIRGVASRVENAVEIHFAPHFLWVMLFFCFCFALFMFGIMYAKQQKKFSFLFISLLAVFVQILGFNAVSSKGVLQTISVEEIQDILTKEEDAMVYIGRKNCPDCFVYKPKLVSFLKREDFEIKYLDTTGNEKEMADFRKFYNQLGVQSVPAVFSIKKGKVQKIFYGEKEPEKIEKAIKTFFKEE